MTDRKPEVGSDAWFKEIENRLHVLADRLIDASALIAGSKSTREQVDRHLSIVQELVARAEDRVMRAAAEAGKAVNGEILALDHYEPVQYRDLPGFPGYRVGDDGSIWGSRSAGRGYGRTRDWRKLKPYLVRPGPALTVSLYRDRTRHIARVDSLVMLAFEGPAPERSEIVHRNGDRLDNRRANLVYVSRVAA